MLVYAHHKLLLLLLLATISRAIIGCQVPHNGVTKCGMEFTITFKLNIDFELPAFTQLPWPAQLSWFTAVWPAVLGECPRILGMSLASTWWIKWIPLAAPLWGFSLVQGLQIHRLQMQSLQMN